MEEFLVFCGFVIACVFGLLAVQMFLKDRQRRLGMLEQALKSDAIDAESKRMIVDSLNAPSWPIRKILFSIGWLAIFLGVSLMFGGRDMFYVGIVVAPLGLGVVTLPIALRELDARKTV